MIEKKTRYDKGNETWKKKTPVLIRFRRSSFMQQKKKKKSTLVKMKYLYPAVSAMSKAATQEKPG